MPGSITVKESDCIKRRCGECGNDLFNLVYRVMVYPGGPASKVPVSTQVAVFRCCECETILPPASIADGLLMTSDKG